MSRARSEYKDVQRLAPDAFETVQTLGKLAAKAGLDKQLLELIKLRASQINGCAFCVQYHILQGESLGVPTDKLNLVVVWREVPQFSARERAARAWTKALTLLPSGVSDEVYAQAAAEFSEQELVYLTSAICIDQCLEPVRRRLSLDPAGSTKERTGSGVLTRRTLATQRQQFLSGVPHQMSKSDLPSTCKPCVKSKSVVRITKGALPSTTMCCLTSPSDGRSIGSSTSCGVLLSEIEGET